MAGRRHGQTLIAAVRGSGILTRLRSTDERLLAASTRIQRSMSHAADTLTHIDPSLVWDQLSEHIDQFIEVWEDAPKPPVLLDFVPAGPPILRRLTLVELIKVDLEHRWHGRRWPKLIEQYLSDFPELAADGGIPCDLVYEEFHVRRQQGDDVTLEEFCDRFPTRAGELRRLLSIDAPTQSTLLVEARKIPSFEPGQLLDDFELLAPLGKGAFATVFRARQKSMQRIVALKICAIAASNRRHLLSSNTQISSTCSISGNWSTRGCDCSTCNTFREVRCTACLSTSGPGPPNAYPERRCWPPSTRRCSKTVKNHRPTRSRATNC